MSPAAAIPLPRAPTPLPCVATREWQPRPGRWQQHGSRFSDTAFLRGKEGQLSTKPHISLAEADGHPDQVRDRVAHDMVASRPRIQRQLDRLREQPLLDRGLAVEFLSKLIEIELELAAAAVAGELAGESTSFAAAVAAEVAAWDLYLERLQVQASYLPSDARATAEDGLRELRRHRHELAQLVAAVESDPAEWRTHRGEAVAIRRRLEQARDAIPL